MSGIFRRPWIANRTTEIGLGLLAVVAGFCLLWDAYEGRGIPKPKILGPFLPY